MRERSVPGGSWIAFVATYDNHTKLTTVTRNGRAAFDGQGDWNY